MLSFNVKLAKEYATSITLVTPVPNFSYRIGQGILLVNPPSYTTVPSYAMKTWAYSFTSITPAASFISLQTNPSMIQIATSAFPSYGAYLVTIKTTEMNTLKTGTSSFTVKVFCITALEPNLMADQVYYINDPAFSFDFSFTQTPSTCPFKLVSTVTLENGSPLPATIRYTAPFTITVFETVLTSVVVHSVKVTTVDPMTSLTAGIVVKVSILCIK